MWTRLILCSVCFLLLFLCSCSRIRYLEITTTPPEADISMNGVPLGASPVIYQIPHKDFFLCEHNIAARKEGYSDTAKKIDSFWWKSEYNLVKDLRTGKKGGRLNIILFREPAPK